MSCSLIVIVRHLAFNLENIICKNCEHGYSMTRIFRRKAELLLTEMKIMLKLYFQTILFVAYFGLRHE